MIKFHSLNVRKKPRAVVLTLESRLELMRNMRPKAVKIRAREVIV